MEIKKTKISKIESIGEIDDWVYDLTIDHPTDQWFFANNILAHNSCYFAIDKDVQDEAVKRADEISSKVNSTFQSFVKDAFYVQDDFSDLIKAEREIVAKSGIFVTRKRYILNIVDDEGKSVDKLKTMGLDIKKTILPKFYQTELANFIGRFLRGEMWDDVARDVVKLKQHIRKDVPLEKLGLPKRVQKIESYTEAFNKDVKTALPGHVAASIHYNSCLKQYEDTASNEIRSGDKIQVFYLKTKRGPNEKFKSIALPVDLNVVPQWFEEYYIGDIDINAQLTRLVDKPLENILKVIGEEVPTAQSLYAKDSITFG